MTFARYMELALYAPGLGYYMRDADRIGATGDYYTSSHLHPLFGEMIARQLDEMATVLGGAFTVVEQGAGKGALAYDVLSALGRGTAAAGRLSYVIVERSPAMVARQRRLLDPWAASGAVQWAEALPAAPIEGCILSNELVDAFPVHRVVRRDGRLAEVYVDAAADGLVETIGPPSTPELEAYLARVGATLIEGQCADINLAALDWMRGVGRALGRGFALTVDYGYPADELFAPHRRRGTLLAYSRHRTNEAFYDRIGRQDLTAHVDFQALKRAAGAAGAQVFGPIDQGRWLTALGIRVRADSLKKASLGRAREIDAALKRLIGGDAMGRLFKALALASPGMPKPPGFV